MSSWSKILRASASCAFALSAGDVVVLIEPEGVVVDGVVVAGAAVEGVVIEVVGGIVADGGAVDGDVCATLARSREDVDVV